MKILILDNYDSFTYILDQYLGTLGCETTVVLNDELGPDEAMAVGPDAILISPGPGTPAESGISVPLIRRAMGEVPLLGVCLGQQAIVEALGGRTVRGARLMHGKTSVIHHEGRGIFQDVPSPMTVMRYHSLVAPEESIPDDLEIVARCEDPPHEVMAVAARGMPVYGVQFHPESIGSEHGMLLLSNFLSEVRRGL